MTTTFWTVFWLLILGHFIADYPLQSDAMVKAKKHLSGLIRHALVHLITKLVLVFAFLNDFRYSIIVFVFILTFVHFSIDVGKTELAKLKPQWVIIPYFVDQLLHILSITLITYWFSQINQTISAIVPTKWLIYGTSYLLITYFWFISERVTFYADKSYQPFINQSKWLRMVGRMILLGTLLNISSVWLLVICVILLSLLWSYLPTNYRQRIVLIDVSVVIAVTLFTKLALLTT